MYVFSVYCMHTPIIGITGNIEHKLKVSGGDYADIKQ